VVLSNNDGCVVSRSREAKLLGISNGTPWFKIRDQAEHDGVVARSSNYELYASLSRRMMRLMAATLPDQKIYSINECFLRSFQNPQRTKGRGYVNFEHGSYNRQNLTTLII
jgi:DNA polymerase V